MKSLLLLPALAAALMFSSCATTGKTGSCCSTSAKHCCAAAAKMGTACCAPAGKACPHPCTASCKK